jgi:hypothetical protein
MDPQPEALNERPVIVTRAVQLLALALIIGLIRSIVAAIAAAAGRTFVAVAAIVFVLAFFGLMFFFVWKISARRNWPRFVLLVLLIIGLPYAIPAYVGELRRNLPSGLLSIALASLQTIGIVLLFLPKANNWFRNRT